MSYQTIIVCDECSKNSLSKGFGATHNLSRLNELLANEKEMRIPGQTLAFLTSFELPPTESQRSK